MDYFNLNLGNTAAVPQRGKLLIAEPLLSDPNFSRSVVFLCEHNDEGSVGFVLNQPTELTSADILSDPGIQSVHISNGGPVQPDTLHVLHCIPEMDGGIEVTNGIYWGASYDQLKAVLSAGYSASDHIRLFLGYSGWSPGQLENEIKEGAWLVADAPTSLVFETQPKEVWKQAIALLGKKYSFLANIPIDPQLN